MTGPLPDYQAFYRGRSVMITGGLGFIGSNLARQLVGLGARVLLIDSLISDYGGNLFNIEGIEDRLKVNVADVRQQSTMNYLVQGHDVIFNLAGQVSHIDSMREPYTDLEINCRAQLSLLEACRHNNPSVKVVFAGTRQIYGRPDFLPVTESHLVRPTDVNGINKAAGEYYHMVYNNVFGVHACSLRLTNVYGPRQLIKHNRQGFIAWFIRQAIEDREIQIYGDGEQLRDFVYVDDAADAFLRAGASDRSNGEGVQRRRRRGRSPCAQLVEMLISVAGTGRYRLIDWPARKEGDRHRRLPLRLVAHRAHARLAAEDVASRRTAAHHRVLPRSTCRTTCRAGCRSPRCDRVVFPPFHRSQSW